MVDKFLLLALAAAGMITSMVIIANFLRSKLNVFHPLVILFLVSIIDVYLPGMIWAVDQLPVQPNWVNPLTYNDVTAGTLVYLMSYLIMVFGYTLVSSRLGADSARQQYQLRNGLLIWSLWISLFLCFLQLALIIQSYGSVLEWFYGKILIRWDGGLDSAREVSVLEFVPFRIVFSMLVIVGFYYRHDLRKPYLLGLFFPVVGIILAAATFFRGSMLVYVLGLLFVERLRILKSGSAIGSERPRLILDRVLMKWAASAVCLFMLYGGVREQLSKESWGNESSEQAKSIPFSKGDGLVGISSIVKYFDSSKNIMLGKTYIDMLLLPVPRIIYPSKPKWYGIDDITRSMGWPESTQSAVTMPGESYANFWFAGPFFMLLLGALFAAVNRIACAWGEIGMFLYPSVLLYLVINSNWMSFTGIANQIFPTLFCGVLLKFIFRKCGNSRIKNSISGNTDNGKTVDGRYIT